MNKKTIFAICFGIAGFLVSGAAHAEKAAAVIQGTAEGSAAAGTVHFEETGAGLKVSGQLSGFPAGKHGFHIHENGSCADAGKAAGNHFNPDNHPHGNLLKATLGETHAGDLGNVEILADGTGNYEAVIPGLTLSEGKYNVLGRSVIVHEKEDDFGQPLGNAGARIGCGIIEKAQ